MLLRRLLPVFAGVALGTVLQPSSADTFSPFGITAPTLDAKTDIAWAKLAVKFNPFAHR
jgi:hypothetical protein